MPAGTFGISFSPTAQNAAENAQNSQGQTPIQDAVKLISLRIPRFVGAGRGIAPPELLGAMGSGAFPRAGGVPGGLEELLRRMFGQDGPGAFAPSASMPGLPSGPVIPRITPGSGNWPDGGSYEPPPPPAPPPVWRGGPFVQEPDVQNAMSDGGAAYRNTPAPVAGGASGGEPIVRSGGGRVSGGPIFRGPGAWRPY